MRVNAFINAKNTDINIHTIKVIAKKVFIAR